MTAPTIDIAASVARAMFRPIADVSVSARQSVADVSAVLRSVCFLCRRWSSAVCRLIVVSAAVLDSLPARLAVVSALPFDVSSKRVVTAACVRLTPIVRALMRVVGNVRIAAGARGAVVRRRRAFCGWIITINVRL